MTPAIRLINHDTLIVSPTQLNAMKMCKRYWQHQYLYRRVRSGAFAARDGGSAFDRSMNLRYSHAGAQAVGAPLEALMLAAIDDAFAPLDLPLDEYRTAARYKDVVALYNAHYREEPFDVLGVQVPFCVELGSVPVTPAFWRRYDTALNDPPPRVRVLLHGILDLLVRQRESGMVLVVDTKTSNSWDERRQSEYLNHAQMKAYAWAVPRIKAQAVARGIVDERLALLPDIVHGTMPNVVVIRAPYKREGAADAYNARPRTEFHRFIVPYSQERLDEWRDDTLAEVEYALTCVARDHYPQNEKHCAFNFGSKCPYIDVCPVPAAQREMVLASDLFQDYKSAPALDKEALA